jgi:hypothetical protein
MKSLLNSRDECRCKQEWIHRATQTPLFLPGFNSGEGMAWSFFNRHESVTNDFLRQKLEE